MSKVLGFILSYIANSVWEVSVIAGAGWLVNFLLRKLGPRSAHIHWVVTLLLAVVAPALPFLRWLFALIFMPHSMVTRTSVTFVAAPIHVESFQRGLELPDLTASCFVLLYLGVLLYFALRLGWTSRNTLALLRETSPALLTAEQEEIWRQCKLAYALPSVQLQISEKVSGPVTLGFRKPVLLVPPRFMEGCTAQDLLSAFAHECAHMERHDFAKNLFYEVVSLVLFFHPVVWMLKSQIAQTREMVCDGMAVDRAIDSHSYTQSLLRLASMVYEHARVPVSHAVGIFDANILEKRVMVMRIKTPKLNPSVQYGLVLSAVLFLASVAAAGATRAIAVEPESALQRVPMHGPVYQVGNGVSAPVLRFQADPEYPKAAQEGNGKLRSGMCFISLVVDAKGMPTDVHVAKSLNPDFDANAIKAVQQWRFSPARRSGKPVAVALNVEVNFQKF
ncbi:TonB family protein [Terriglobus saanensis]|uniref:TonB family protein n=1 Tax=Terriglobus saanensis (strain ATCC BAA-1853 / DSM 23119 / SP1PR4) TaxID=401053 RepID=E8V5J2_TERSS|nr:TonB family protein [Terriglobus saanensis]ADV81526.1 TonB family protein [Terriglobus saanensis SP1PR4]